MSTSYWEMAEMPNLEHVNVQAKKSSKEKLTDSVMLPKKKVITRDKRQKVQPIHSLKGPSMKNQKIMHKNKNVMKQSLKPSPRQDYMHRSPRSKSKSSRECSKTSPRYESLNSDVIKPKKWVTPEMY